MTPPRGADRPGPPDFGTEPLPRIGARLAQPSEAAGPDGAADGPPVDRRPSGGPWAERPDHDTGPIPLAGSGRPLPPATGRASAVPAADGAGLTEMLPADVPPAEVPPTAVPDEARAAGAPSAAGATPAGRAGRNMAAAIGVGVGLAGLIVLSLLIWRPAFLVVLTAAILIGVFELTRALEAGGFRAPLVPLLVGSLAMTSLAWTRGPSGLVVGFMATVLAVLLWRLAGGPVGYRRDVAAGALVALYVPLLAGFAVLLLVPGDGATRVLTFIATVVASDVGGFAAGVLFGKHPMAPSISPKKSWEGMAGSVAACMLVATPLVALALDGPWWGGVAFGAALAVSATVGDLGESLIKRDLGIKDMGNLLPGHGGLMDRLDSLLPSAALAYLLLSVLAPV